jgi:hypothetical protein
VTVRDRDTALSPSSSKFAPYVRRSGQISSGESDGTPTVAGAPSSTHVVNALGMKPASTK